MECKQTWSSFQKHLWTWVNQNWANLFSETMASFDQKPEPRGLFHLEQVACPSSEPVTNIWAKELSFLKQKLGKVVFPPGRVKLLEGKGLASTPALFTPENSPGSPRGGFCCSDFSHTLLSNEFKPFLVQIPTEERKKVTTLQFSYYYANRLIRQCSSEN